MTEQLALNALALHDWIAQRLDDLPLPSGTRQALAISCYDLVVEHHVGIAVLARNQVYGSAFSLVRSVFETFVRGVWLRHCATQAQIEKYQSDRLDLSFGQLINAVEQVEGFGDGVLSGLKANSWKAMNSYTHGGALQAGRRFQGDNVSPNYDREEVREVLRLSGAFALMAFQQIAIESGRQDLANQALERLAPDKSR